MPISDVFSVRRQCGGGRRKALKQGRDERGRIKEGMKKRKEERKDERKKRKRKGKRERGKEGRKDCCRTGREIREESSKDKRK